MKIEAGFLSNLTAGQKFAFFPITSSEPFRRYDLNPRLPSRFRLLSGPRPTTRRWAFCSAAIVTGVLEADPCVLLGATVDLTRVRARMHASTPPRPIAEYISYRNTGYFLGMQIMRFIQYIIR